MPHMKLITFLRRACHQKGVLTRSARKIPRFPIGTKFRDDKMLTPEPQGLGRLAMIGILFISTSLTVFWGLSAHNCEMGNMSMNYNFPKPPKTCGF